MFRFIVFIAVFAWIIYGGFAAFRASEDGESTGAVIVRLLTAAPVDLFNWIKDRI